MAVIDAPILKILSDLDIDLMDIEGDEDYLRALMEAVNSLIITNASDNRIPILQEEVKRVRAHRKAAAPSPAMKKVSIDKLMGRKAASVQKIQSQKLLPAVSEEDGEKNQTLNTNNLADRLNNIVEALGVLFNLKKQELNVDKRAAEQDLQTQSEEEKAAREEELERKKKKEASKPKALPKPFTSFFDTIKTFFGNILAGSIVLKMLDWLKDPQNKKKIDKFIGFLKDNALAIVGIIAFVAALPLISTLLSFTSLLISGISLIFGPLGWLFSASGLLALAAVAATPFVWARARDWAAGGSAFRNAEISIDKKGIELGVMPDGQLLDMDPNSENYKKPLMILEGPLGALGIKQSANLKWKSHRKYATPAQLEFWEQKGDSLGEIQTIRQQMKKELSLSEREIRSRRFDERPDAVKSDPEGAAALAYYKETYQEVKAAANLIRSTYANDPRLTKFITGEHHGWDTGVASVTGKDRPGASENGTGTNKEQLDFGFGNIQNQIEDLQKQQVNLQKNVPSREISQPLTGGEGKINFMDLGTDQDPGQITSGTESGNPGAVFSSNRGRVGNRVILGVLN